jgi:predicted NAD/FAD-binding protein
MEQAVLGALPYRGNVAVLHTDAAQLPPQPAHRSSWNHWQASCRAGQGPNVDTYWLNMLQNIDSSTDYLVTLGAVDRVDPATVLARISYEHPLYTVDSAAARVRVGELNSPRTAYAGAYQGWGFHEDGCRSGVAAAAWFGVGW